MEWGLDVVLQIRVRAIRVSFGAYHPEVAEQLDKVRPLQAKRSGCLTLIAAGLSQRSSKDLSPTRIHLGVIPPPFRERKQARKRSTVRPGPILATRDLPP